VQRYLFWALKVDYCSSYVVHLENHTFDMWLVVYPKFSLELQRTQFNPEPNQSLQFSSEFWSNQTASLICGSWPEEFDVGISSATLVRCGTFLPFWLVLYSHMILHVWYNTIHTTCNPCAFVRVHCSVPEYMSWHLHCHDKWQRGPRQAHISTFDQPGWTWTELQTVGVLSAIWK